MTVGLARRATSPRALLWAAMGAFALGFASLSLLRHRAFNTGRFDLGNMTQAVWSTAHGDPLETTNLDGEQVSRLAAHVDPILVAFAPAWWIWPSPDLLVVAQALLIALGALPVFWLARKHLGSERGALGFAFAYLLYPATGWLALNEFHPVALACPFLLFAIWYLDEGRLLPFVAFAALAATTKEEIGLVVAGLGAWHALGKRRWLEGAAVAAAGAAASVIAFAVVIPHFNEGNASPFYGRYRHVGGSPRGILEKAFTDPLVLLEAAFDGRGVTYLAELAVPLALLWAFAPLVLLAALPELAANLLSATSTQTSIHHHYTAGEIPPLLAASVLGAARLVRPRPHRAAAIGVLAAAVALAANYRIGPIPLWRELPLGERFGAREHWVTRHDRIAGEGLRRVPRGAVVTATNSLGAHLSERRRILSFPLLADATWAAVDETRPSFRDRNDQVAAVRALVRLREDPRWRVVFERDGIVILRRVR